MEYVVSARKYRPLTFSSVVGQETLTTTLKNAISSQRLAHAYLFAGPRGVGKTTCARIFARTINCEHTTADGEACGVCENCKAFLEGRSFNIFELDAASNNGVDYMHDLIDQTRVPPQIGQYKVFIIDEVHMLSANAFNAFLKTLEEPPSYVIFILATTEKHKILPTIISRCQIYDFDRITLQDIVAHLKMVAQKEGYTYEEDALDVIAEKADGAMRDALSTFDQVANYCQGNITYAKTIEDLNVLDVDNYFRIVDLALDGKVTDEMLLLNDIIGKGFDAGNTCQGLARHLRNVMMARDERTLALLDASDKQKARLAEQAKRCTEKFVYRALKVLTNCEVNYRESANKRLLVELSLMEMAEKTQGAEESPSSGRSTKEEKKLDKEFTQDELTLEWQRMCQQMKTDPEMEHFSSRLAHVSPVITSFPQVEIVAESEPLYECLTKLKDYVVESLAKALSNRSLTIDLRLAEPDEFKPLPTRAEQVDEMRKSNPGVELLFDRLGLQLY